MRGRLFLICSILAVLTAAAPGACFAGEAVAEKKARAVEAAREITDMRSTLAASLIEPGAEITPETFKNVCGQVGKRAKEIAKSEGFKIRHSSVKYRNPDHAATPEEKLLIKRFDAERDLAGTWDTFKRDGKKAHRYSMPIFVEKACLACHGDKDDRPEFIKKNYPEDNAYGYEVGDIRGMISVTLPPR